MLMMLMYHRILPEEHREAVSVSLFRRQLDYLEKHYRFVTPEEVIDWCRGKWSGPAGENLVALSFDDGWADNWLFATEVLRERKLRAVLAMSAGYFYDAPVRKSEEPGILTLSMAEAQKRAAQGDLRSYVSLSELKAMQDSGVWRIEAHGTQHVKGRNDASILAMPQQGETADSYAARLREDIGSCREKLGSVTGVRPEMFFWPWGHYTTLGAETVRGMGLLQFTISKGTIPCGAGDKVLPRIGVSPRWKKFHKNCFVFRHPVLAAIHDLFHTERVCFDPLPGEEAFR